MGQELCLERRTQCSQRFDGQLDQIMQQLRDDDELGEQEGYRWVHSVVNEAVPGDERVGEKRVRAAVKGFPITDCQLGSRQSGNRVIGRRFARLHRLV